MWKVGEPSDYEDVCFIPVFVDDANVASIWVLGDRPYGDWSEEAYARSDKIRSERASLIVRAVNTHDALVEALEAVSAQLRKRECSIKDCKVLDSADAAMLLASGADQ
jgi:hypothetical protein